MVLILSLISCQHHVRMFTMWRLSETRTLVANARSRSWRFSVCRSSSWHCLSISECLASNNASNWATESNSSLSKEACFSFSSCYREIHIREHITAEIKRLTRFELGLKNVPHNYEDLPSSIVKIIGKKFFNTHLKSTEISKIPIENQNKFAMRSKNCNLSNLYPKSLLNLIHYLAFLSRSDSIKFMSNDFYPWS